MVASNYEDSPPEVIVLIRVMIDYLYNRKATPQNRKYIGDICQRIHDLEPTLQIIWSDRAYPILEVKENILEGL